MVPLQGGIQIIFYQRPQYRLSPVFYPEKDSSPYKNYEKFCLLIYQNLHINLPSFYQILY